MSSKIAAAAAVSAAVVVRVYDEESDKRDVEDLERKCDETGNHGKPVMVSDLLGDPVRRVRHFPSHTMLVAEYGEGRKMVGVVRGCVKTVARGNSIFVKLAYVLGLRVSPSHRNLGIGTKLVQALEEWFKQQGATYAYMATDCTNEPSINLFTKKCSYVKFRTPTMLVQPVHAHTKPIGSDITILRLTPQTAESIYTCIFKDSEFFPRDIDAILTSRNSIGTFIALPNEKHGPKLNRLLDCGFPGNFAILSVWSTKDVFRLQMKGVSRLTHAFCSGSRLLDSCMPWMKLPSFPNVFDKFWVYFMYGMHMEGKDGPRLMNSLCSFVHNIGRYDRGCGALAAELSPSDSVALAVPHWKRLSWAHDLWCVKKLSDEPDSSDWTRSRSSSSVIFVDPRDI